MSGIPSEVFEFINGAFTTLGVGLLIIFGRYLIYELKDNGFIRVRLQAAISIAVFMVGEVITRGWVWIVRYIENTGGDTRWLLHLPYGLIPVVGATIGCLGVLCMIRVFSPDDWGRYGWIICAAGSFSIVGATYIFR